MAGPIVVSDPNRPRLAVLSEFPGGQDPIEADRKFRPDIYWYLSFRCNLACRHCSVFSSPYVDTSDDLSTEDSMQVIDQMAELGVGTVLVSGGEVLYRPDALQILQGILDRDLDIGLETNGTLLPDGFLELAREGQKRGKLVMCISVDGGTPEAHDNVRGPNTFRRTVANLERMRDEGIKFDIQCILNKHNYHSIPNLVEVASSLRPALGNLQFGFLNPVGRGDEFILEAGLSYQDMNPIFNLITRHGADFDGKILIKAPPASIPPQHLGKIHVSKQMSTCVSCQFPLLGVLPNGDITICALSRDNDEVFYGNVRDRRLKDIWTEARMDMLRKRYVTATGLEGICGDCIWRNRCKGACRAWAYEHGGTFDAPFPICDLLDKEGMFPQAYRVSRNEAILDRFQQTPPAEGNIELSTDCMGP